jgi:two-component system, OmpR family, response regulator
MKLLVVEDEPQMAALLQRGLIEEGHVVDHCDSGAVACQQARIVGYDVIILDWGLPDMDGVSVLRSWRSNGILTPVLMLTARTTLGERVLGLRSGADDFVAKPFEFAELTARIDALFRRTQQLADASFGDVSLRNAERAFSVGSKQSTLTQREWQFALLLFEKHGDIVTRAEVLLTVWGAHFTGEPNIVDVYVGYLRSKLAQVTNKVTIRAVRGTGYRLELVKL